MNHTACQRFEIALNELRDRIFAYCSKNLDKEQPLGLCVVNPRRASVGMPPDEVHTELQRQATEYFKTKPVDGYYYRYWSPPILPCIESNAIKSEITAEDYQITYELPKFDDLWIRTNLARSFIYCPLDEEQYGWSDWFELQLEAVRLTPLLHQTLKEIQIKITFNIQLGLPGKPVFESFIYDYAVTDTNFPEMSTSERDCWKTRKLDWKERYRLAAEVIKPAKTLKELYSIARKKAASTRNPMLKSLFKSFVEHIENSLVLNTDLPAEEKKRLIHHLRQTRTRVSSYKYVAKRPAVCISDVECAQVLYRLILDYLTGKKRDNSIAETILFIWIAQHAAFSGLQLKVENILTLRVTDIDFKDLTITVKEQEIHLTGGLTEILRAWLGDQERTNKRLLFQNISYDRLEDILNRVTSRLCGSDGKLLPRDFLEKVHVIPGARIPLELRKQITQQEELVKQSPYRIDTRIIKKHIKDAIEKNQPQVAT